MTLPVNTSPTTARRCDATSTDHQVVFHSPLPTAPWVLPEHRRDKEGTSLKFGQVYANSYTPLIKPLEWFLSFPNQQAKQINLLGVLYCSHLSEWYHLIRATLLVQSWTQPWCCFLLFFKFSQPQSHVTQTHCISWPCWLFFIPPCRSFMVSPTWLTIKSYSSLQISAVYIPCSKASCNNASLKAPVLLPMEADCVIDQASTLNSMCLLSLQVCLIFGVHDKYESPLNLCWIKDLLWGGEKKKKNLVK